MGGYLGAAQWWRSQGARSTWAWQLAGALGSPENDGYSKSRESWAQRRARGETRPAEVDEADGAVHGRSVKIVFGLPE